MFLRKLYNQKNACYLFGFVLHGLDVLISSAHHYKVINVYDQKYETGAAFWPDVHRRLIICLIISQLLLMGLLSTKKAMQATPLLLALPILTIWFHKYCQGRFESAFVKFPLQVSN